MNLKKLSPTNLVSSDWPPRLDLRAKKAPRWLIVVLVVLYAFTATWAVMSFPYSTSNVTQVFTLLVTLPGVLFMLVMRTTRLWYSWLAVLALSWITVPTMVPAMLLLGWIWIMLATLRAMGLLQKDRA